MNTPSSGGGVTLEDGVVVYRDAGQGERRMSLGDLRVVGELTLPVDPGADDYFLILVAPHEWFSISFDIAGIGELLNRLRVQLDGELELQLAPEIELMSRVIWPERLIGKALFNFEPERPAGLRRVVQTLLGTEQVELILTGEVQRELG